MRIHRTIRALTAAAVLLALSTLPAQAAGLSAHDTDADGIPNSWEINGYDADGDGTIDVDYPGMGADPYHKDVFVEMDYMPGELATEADLDRITESFAELPVRNPDGTTGINIHLDAGNARSEKYNLGGGNEVPHQGLNGMGDWGKIKNNNFDSARERVFHYMLWADYYGSNSSSGLGYLGGRGFIVTVGHTYWGNANSNIRVGTFIHELGHNLNLGHGGANNENAKPHYLSVMNYDYQISGVPRADGSKYFGYSTYEYMTLNENALDERAGFGPNAYGWAYKGNPAHGPIDFNGNGVIDQAPVTKDLNNNGRLNALTAANDMKTMRFAARGAAPGMPNPEEPELEIEENPVTAEVARTQGALD